MKIITKKIWNNNIKIKLKFCRFKLMITDRNISKKCKIINKNLKNNYLY